MKTLIFNTNFVKFIPSELTQGELYISEQYMTAAHLCACGCGTKIVTPLRPTEWRIARQGNLVTLTPSIGNWNHPCQSHYWIRNNRVILAGTMTRPEIDIGRAIDRARKDKYFRENSKDTTPSNTPVFPSQHDANNFIRQNVLMDMLKKLIKVLGF